VPRPSIALKVAAALVALLLMAMSCDPYYELRVSGQNGQVTIDDGPAQALPVQSRLLAGTTVLLVPVPDAGFEFVWWEGDATGSQSPLTIDLVRDLAVVAVFAEVDAPTVEPPSEPPAEPPAAPPNDAFVDATALLGDAGSVDANNVGATTEAGEPDHAGLSGGASVWWRFEAGEDGTLTFDTTGSAIDTVLAVYTGATLAGLSEVASDAGGGTGVASAVSFAATAGVDYRVAVDGAGGSTGAIRLDWSLEPDAGPGPEPDPTLTVSLAGEGAGRVTSSPAGIDCGTDCSEPFAAGTPVTLTATPETGDEFAGWSGACIGTEPCDVVMDQARSVTATFSPPDAPPPPQAILRIDVTPDDAAWTVRNDDAGGSVVASGTGDDALGLSPGTYHLSASRSLHADATDVVTLADGDDVTVALPLTRTYQLGIQGSDGQVLVDGVPRALPFLGTYLGGATVQLDADPDAGYAFASWTGSLSSSDASIVVTMDEDVSLTASFVDAAPPRIAILDPVDGEVVTVNEIAVTGTAIDDETAVDAVEARLAGGPWNACDRPNGSQFRCLVTSLEPNVTSQVDVRAVDAQGNTATASVTVRFEPPPPAPGYDIEVVYFDETFSASQKAVFQAAASRWQEIVVGDLQDVPVLVPANGSCGRGEPLLDTTVDDLLIFATSFTDAPGGVLGSAGPCVIRAAGDDAGTALLGLMQFDTADLDDLEAAGLLEDVIVHEMGHVLGLGSLWEYRGLLDFEASDGAPSCRDAASFTVDPTFLGASGVAAWQDDLGGFGDVPVENDGGPGTRCGHWDEETFGTELMTGYLDVGGQALSVLSVRSLEDLGLTVDPTVADPYVVPSAGALRTQGLFDIAAAEVVLMPRGTVDPATGTFRPLD